MVHRIFILLISFFALMGTGLAQSATTTDEVDLGFDPLSIVEEWEQWRVEPTVENAFVGQFMDEFNVPKKGSNGLNRKETWYWWVSHHPEEVKEYILRREAQSGVAE